MLTIQVNDTRLETRLVQRAKATGKSTQQVAEELLVEALDQLKPVDLSFTKLDPKQHSRPLQFDVDPQTDNGPAFQHVSDATEFARSLHQNALRH